MCDMIAKGITVVKDAVWNAGDIVVDCVKNSCMCCGRRFEKLTNKILPTNVASIVQKMVYALPVTVAALYTPSYLTLPLLATYAIVHIVHDLAGAKGTNPFSQGSYEKLFTGIGTANIYLAARETVQLAMRAKGANPISIAIHLLIASFFYSKAVDITFPHFRSSQSTAGAPPTVPESTIHVVDPALS